MHARDDRWEQGSEFHHLDLQGPADAPPPWAGGLLLGSGRDALRLIIQHGRAVRGWRRVWVPAYFCQEVVAAIAGEGLPVCVYPDLPIRSWEWPALSQGDALLVVNTLGLRSRPELTLPPGVDVVEDHTHDPTSPWAARSVADFAVASLRKTLPIPEGGGLWSPRRHALPALPPETAIRRAAAVAKREAMALKARYLSGQPVEKVDFRRLAISGEEGIAVGEPSAMTRLTMEWLERCPISAWRAARAANYRSMLERLAAVPGLKVLQPAALDAVPFSVPLVLASSAARDKMRSALIERRIYPAVLWPLESRVCDVPEEAIEFSRRVLSVHCDGRYQEQDIVRVVKSIEEIAAG